MHVAHICYLINILSKNLPSQWIWITLWNDLCFEAVFIRKVSSSLEIQTPYASLKSYNDTIPMFQIKGDVPPWKKSFNHSGLFYIELCQRTKNGKNSSESSTICWQSQRTETSKDHKMKPLSVTEDGGL